MNKKNQKILNLQPLVNHLIEKSDLKDLIKQITQKFPQTYLVGGAVRDYILERPFKDYDFVVEGVEKDELYQFLSSLPGKLVDIQSRNFGVFKYRPTNSKMVVDIALPRIDIYQQYFLGHQDVQIVSHHKLSIYDDLSRRDFTINSLAVNLQTGELIDPFGGVGDLGLSNQTGLIRAVGDPYERLVKEDPTRIMRALRFACQLNFPIEEKTYEVIKKNHHQISATILSKEQDKPKKITRVAGEVLAAEFVKGFAANPSMMIELLDDSQIYQSILTPNLVATWEGLKTTEQPPDYHAEGNVWNHTMLALKNIPKLTDNKIGLPTEISLSVKLAAFLHDFGKVATFVLKDNNYTYYNHPEVSMNLAHEFIKHLKLSSAFAKKDKMYVDTKKIEFLVGKHMLPFNVNATEIKERKVIRYFLEDEVRGLELLQVCYLDAISAVKSGNKPANFHSIQQFFKRINLVKQKLVTPLSQEEISYLKQELSRSLYKKIFTSPQKKTLLQKISNGQILDQSDLDLINTILIELGNNEDKDKISKNCQAVLTKIISKKTPYPISGDTIKNLLNTNQSILQTMTSPSAYLEIKQAIDNPRGGHIIGRLKEMFLQDRLDNPGIYINSASQKFSKKFHQYLIKKIIDYFTNTI